MMKKAKKKIKHYTLLSNVLCVHSGAPGNKYKDLENSDINKRNLIQWPVQKSL